MTKNQFLDAPKLLGVVVHDEPIDPSAPPMVRGVKRHYLELPRGITLKRFVNTGRTVIRPFFITVLYTAISRVAN